MSTMIFEITDKLVRVIESTPPEPGARLIVMDDAGVGAWLCVVESTCYTTEDGWSLKLLDLPWPDGWSVHKRGDGYEIHRPTAPKEDDQ